MKTLNILVILLFIPLSLLSQARLPIIDIHLHATSADAQGPPPLGMCTPINPFPAWDPAEPYGAVFMKFFKEPACSDPVWSPMTDEELKLQTLDVMERLNIYGVVSGSAEFVDRWYKSAPHRIMPALIFNILDTPPTPDYLKELHKAGRLEVFGEITNQYSGVAPDDERMDPYWELMQELDIPVSIHVGTGPPGVIYLGFTNYRGRHHSALTLEETLVKYPRLRVSIAHAGFPLLDDLLATMYAHPQVYVDLGVIIFTQPRPVFYRFLQGIVEAGFGNRVLFGTDQMVWPGVIERSVAVIEEAPFLTEQQKRDILYNNAVRYLRLDEETVARHHRGQ